MSLYCYNDHDALHHALLSESVGMCRPLDTPPLFTSGSDLKDTPVGYHFIILSHSLWVIYVKFSYSTTLLGSFLWKFDTPVGVKIHLADTPVGVKIPQRTPHPYPFRGKVPPPRVTHLSILLHWSHCSPPCSSDPTPPWWVILHLSILLHRSRCTPIIF